MNLLSSSNQALTDDQWDGFVETHPGGHLLQTSRWGALKARFGWRVERVVLAEHGHIVAGGQMLVRRLPWGQTLAYVPKGPIVDWQRPAQVRLLLDGLMAAGRRYRPALIKLEPDLPHSPLLDLLLRSYGLTRGHPIQPRSTIHINLDDGPAGALADMKQKWRYNVRLSARKGVLVRKGTHDDLPAFNLLTQETGRRDGFGVHEPAYYEAAYDLFAGDETACWLLAEYQGQLLGAVVAFAVGFKSWYMWGASSTEERQRMPNHALQWAAMEWAAQRGCRTYDLWGIPDEVGADPERWTADYADRQGGLWGVYRFKQGFGGQVVRYTGAWDLILSRAGARMYHLTRRLRG